MTLTLTLIYISHSISVSFGGIAGLFLGCSLISGMELAYFLCIEVPAFGIRELRQRFRAKRRMDTAAATPTVNLRQNMPSQLEQYIMQLKVEQASQKATSQFQKWQRQTFAHKHVISK